MPVITLPDGQQKKFDAPVTVFEVASLISKGLAQHALAGQVNDKLVDTCYPIQEDATLRILTGNDPEGLTVIRHSAAHVLAQAVKALVPSAQVTIGPVIENGFYYDFAFERAFSENDLVAIEKKMHEIITKNHPVSRQTMTRDEAIQFFDKIGETYKVKIIQDIPANEVLSLYTQDDFTDLCRGPHVPSTGMIKAFKLTKVSGAYWRGDSKNAMLQRIYGTAWHDKKALEQYLHLLEEAEKRDHRKQAKIMDLFHFQEEAPGMVFWHENGWTIYQVIKKYIQQRILEDDYQEVATPQVVDLTLWKQSGHWDMFHEEMFTVEVDDRSYALKPMNCPCHVQIFK